MMSSTGYLPVEGGRLYYETSGDPAHPALVMIHAGVADLRMWEPQVSAFSDRFFCVRYDVRGAGKTETDLGQFNNRRDLLALLDHLTLDRVILMGCSRGGQISTDFTVETPTRVRGLVLVGSGLTGFQGVVTTVQEDELFAKMEKAEQAGDWELVEALDLQAWYQGVTRTVEEVDPAFLEKGRMMLREGRVHSLKYGNGGLKFVPLNPPTADRLHEIRVPTLIVCGDKDLSDIPVIAQTLANGIVDAEVITMADSTHLPGLEKPAEFNRHLEAFLNRITQS